jgi:hypothetical protein
MEPGERLLLVLPRLPHKLSGSGADASYLKAG